jgi:hypothetical protein
MDQKIEALSEDDLAHADRQRAWVRDHYDDHARREYDSIAGKLRVLDTIIRSNWIEPHETWKLQSLGITFGDAIATVMGMTWAMLEDEHGRSYALQDPGSTIVLFPWTMISKRIERGEVVDVLELFKKTCEWIEEKRPLMKKIAH